MFTYQKLSEVATKYYPKESGYCGVIAISVAAQVPFGKSRSLLFKLGRKDRQGTTTAHIHFALRKLDYVSEYYQDRAWPKTLATATRFLPKKGTFLVYTRGHVSCVRDGVLEDWAAETKSRKRVIAVYQIKAI